MNKKLTTNNNRFDIGAKYFKSFSSNNCKYKTIDISRNR